MWQHNYEPIGGSLGLSAIAAAIPILVLFVMLGILRKPAWMAAIGQWTPNGLAVLRLKDLLYGAPSTAALLVAVLGIGVPAVAAFALTGRRLGGRFAAG